MKILILTCCDSENRAKRFERLTESKRKYANKYEGIDFAFEIRWTDRDFTPMWEKIQMLLDHMDDGYDYLMWMDDDAGFIKFDVDFRIHIPKDGKRFYFTQSRLWYEGEMCKGVTIKDSLINSGVFFVKCCDENKSVLNEWYEKRRNPEGIWPDQCTIIRWYLNNVSVCGFVNTKIFNAYPKEPDDLGTCVAVKTKDTMVLHFIGQMKSLKDKYFGVVRRQAVTHNSIPFLDDGWE